MDIKRKAFVLIFLISHNVVMETFGFTLRENLRRKRDVTRYGQCLQGWGAVMGMTQTVVNRGLNRFHSLLPESLRMINSNVTSAFSDIPGVTVTVHITDVVIGDLELIPITSDLRVATLKVTFLSGSMALRMGMNEESSEVSYDMARQQIELATSVRSYRTIIDNTGPVYVVSMVIKDNNAVQSFTLSGSGGTNEFLINALVANLREKLQQGSKYNLFTFRLAENDDTRSFIPRSIDFTFDFDHTHNGNHVFAALATMPGMEIPVQPRDYIFSNNEILLPNTNLTLTLENQFLLHFIRAEFGKVAATRNMEWAVRSGCPGHLQLVNLESANFVDAAGASVENLEIYIRNEALELFIQVIQPSMSGGITERARCTMPYKLSFNGGHFDVESVDRSCERWTERSWWVIFVYVITAGFAAIIMESLIPSMPDVTNYVGQRLSSFEQGLEIKVGGIALSRYDNVRVTTDSRGNIQLGITVASASH